MKIIQEREKCIGCGSCVAACPKKWKMDKDNKATLIGSKLNEKTNNYELEVEKLECSEEAAISCPISIIHIEK